MKKLIYTLGILAATAITFSSCQKEQSIKEQPSDKFVTVSFTAEKVGLDTRTAAVEGATEVSFVWTEEDLTNIKLFTVGEDSDGKETLTIVANPTITKVSDTKLTISAQVAPNATYTFKAMLSGKWTNDGKKARLSDSQTPSATNFDPNADVLISDNMEVTVGEAEGEEETVATSNLEMVFRRPVVVNKMTLKNMKAGESIEKVVITSSKDIAGYFYNDGTPVGDKKTITLNYNKAVTVPEGGQFPVYFITTPGSEHSLTVEVTTDQFIYTKSFAEGKSIDFNLGQFTKFNFVLPTGVANTSLSLPIEDTMDWAVNGTDESAALNVADIDVTQNEKRVYSSASYVYKGIDGLKMGSNNNRGTLTTSEINLSSAYYISVSAKTWVNSSNSADASQVEFLVDEVSVYKSENLSTEYKTYLFNAPSATEKSKITVKISGKRGYIKDLAIKSGSVALPPVIEVTTDNPLSVANTASSQTIEYEIVNPTEATLTASTEASWITSIDCTTSGKVIFNVAAQEAGASARNGVITLSYEGASDVEVTINQEAGEGGTTTKEFTISSDDVVSNSAYSAYTTEVESRKWLITFGGNNKSVGTNSGNRSKCTLSSYGKYAVSPVTTSTVASAFAGTSLIPNVSKISYTFNGGSNQTNTKVYLLYSSDNETFSQLTLTKGTQGATISSGTEFEFAVCSGYFAVLFEATNTSGAWRIDDVNLTFTYTE